MIKRVVAAVFTAALLVGAIGSTANAVTWGTYSSYYKSNKVVEVKGDTTRFSWGSWSKANAKDTRSDGNEVFAQVRSWRMKERCSSLGNGYYTSSWCNISTDRRATTTSNAVSGKGKKTTAEQSRAWCDYNGRNCANYGYKIQSKACADLGWPVPDSCTRTVTYFHRP